MNLLEKVQMKLREGQLTNNPHLCAEYRAQLAGEYSFWSGMLEDIKIRKPALWNEKRPGFKSDKACDRWYEGTEDGINETGIEIKIKRIDKMMTGLNGLIQMASGNMKNL